MLLPLDSQHRGDPDGCAVPAVGLLGGLGVGVDLHRPVRAFRQRFRMAQRSPGRHVPSLSLLWLWAWNPSLAPTHAASLSQTCATTEEPEKAAEQRVPAALGAAEAVESMAVVAEWGTAPEHWCLGDS